MIEEIQHPRLEIFPCATVSCQNKRMSGKLQMRGSVGDCLILASQNVNWTETNVSVAILAQGSSISWNL